MRHVVRLVTASLTLSATLGVSIAAAAATPPDATWWKRAGGSYWYVDLFPGHGTFAVRQGNPKPSKTVVRGSLKVSGSTMTFTDRSGQLACRGSSTVGTYRFKALARGSKIQLTPIHELCAGRRTVLTGVLQIAGQG